MGRSKGIDYDILHQGDEVVRVQQKGKDSEADRSAGGVSDLDST